MRRLIVNADDFGLDDETVAATIECFEAGAISSATIMAGMPGTEKAIAYAKTHPMFSFGVHFCLVDEVPLCSPSDIPSMVNPKTGRLWATREFIIRNFARLVCVDDIVKEMMAQYNSIKNSGLPISHVDGHGHNHRLPQSIKALSRLKEALGIDRVRRCQDLYISSSRLLGRIVNALMQKKLNEVGFKMTDHFLMACGKTKEGNWFSKSIPSLPEGVTEIGIHPGKQDHERYIDSMDCLKNGAVLYKELGIDLITYKEL